MMFLMQDQALDDEHVSALKKTLQSFRHKQNLGVVQTCCASQVQIIYLLYMGNLFLFVLREYFWQDS